jgi:transposase-like protein
MGEKQNRGEDLRREIAEGIRKLAAEAKTAKKKYTYNASQLAAAIGTSRPSLAKHFDVVDRVLKEIEAQKRMENGEGVIQLMRERIERIELEKEQLKKELEILRNHHAEIYLQVYYNAGNLEPLIRPIVEEEIFEADRCILCHHKIEEIGEEVPIKPKPRKVITLHPHQGTFQNPPK